MTDITYSYTTPDDVTVEAEGTYLILHDRIPPDYNTTVEVVPGYGVVVKVLNAYTPTTGGNVSLYLVDSTHSEVLAALDSWIDSKSSTGTLTIGDDEYTVFVSEVGYSIVSPLCYRVDLQYLEVD